MKLLQEIVLSGSNGISTSKLPKPTTASLAPDQLAKWNTSTRLLASLFNDGLIEGEATPAFLDDQRMGFLFHGKHSKTPSSPAVWIGLSKLGVRLTEKLSCRSTVWPGDFSPPILMTVYNGTSVSGDIEYAPTSLLNHLRPALDHEPIDEKLWETISGELTNAADNGRYWIESYQQRKPLTFQSPMIQWEQSMFSGHPLRPMHRSFEAKDPMPKILPQNISSLTTKTISLISVPGSDVYISGPFRQIIAPLLEQHGLDSRQRGKLILPCVTAQVPVIRSYHPQMEVLVRDAFEFQAQSSLRTVSIPFYDYDLKFSLDVIIGSAIRTISSRTTAILAEVTNILKEVLPENLWLMSDAAGVAGSQPDFDDSKHISCVCRENLNKRALADNVVLVPTGALQEVPPGTEDCIATQIYGLKTEEQKLKWFSEYTEGIIDAFVGPCLDHGVAIECHAQNVLVRLDRSNGKIKGWATRDMGSNKIHLPTLAKSGYEMFTKARGSVVPTESENETWRIIQFCLVENNLNVFIYRLGVSRLAAWKMIREKFDAFFEKRKHLENTQRFRDFIYEEEMQMKAFMVMKFGGHDRRYKYVMVPNMLLEGADMSLYRTNMNGLKRAPVDGPEAL